MRIDDLLYPLSFVKTIPKRERLQAYNETRLRGFIANAKIGKYPMAQRIIKSNGNQLSIKKLESGLVTFNYGDMLEYDSCDGDSINFNRQPTLEICSISCHSLRVNPNPINYTICMNVIACDFYNADFDGDEMNTHHAKYTYTRHEIKAISSFKNYVISHTTNSPQIGQINDSIVGLFELTRSSIKVSRETAMRLFANTTFFPHFTQEVYTGREIISLLLERTPINYSGRPSFYLEHLVPFMNYDSEEIHVEIKAGKMISGVLDAASIGSGGHKNVYHIIERDYGPEMMLETMFNMQQVSIDFIMQRGFSMGIKDVMLPKEARERIKLEESNMINESILISDKLNRGAIVAPIGKTQKEFFEAQQINVLQPTDVYNEIILQNIRKDENGLLSMILSGSKGKLNNLMAITARAGQQLINGERLRETFGYRRTQVYAVRFDKNPIAYGYITNSYISGQTGPEFYANACNARFDLITKALSTSVTGDKNRNAVKNMENTYVDHYRRSIRGFNVVQMLEGEDGLDPRRVERVKFPTVKMSVEEIRKNYAACPAEEIEGLVVDKIKFLEITKGLSGARVGRLPVVDRKIAFDAERIIKNKFGHEIMSRPIEYKNYQRIREWLDGTSNGPSNKKSTNHGLERVFVNTRYAGKIPEQYILGCTFAKIYLRSILATTHYGGRLKPEELESVLLEVETQYKESLIDPGTCIGIQAAQCISAPMTQYALDSHTRSASGGTSKGGMTRIQEVVGAQKTKSLSSPSMYLVPEMDVISDKNTVQKIANMIEMMDLGRFVRRTDIYFEEYGNPVYPGTVKEAKDIEIFDGISAHKRPNDLINWVIRYELDKSKLILKGMSVSTIVKSLTEQNEEQYFMYTSDTSPVVYIRQYFRTIKKKTVTTDLMIELMNATKSQVIRGIPGIISASVVSHVYVDDQFNTNNGYAISTQGTNLLGALLVPGINPNLCHTNSISEVEEVFGICAARNKIIVELGEIVEKGDARHQIMYADEMTRIGKVVSIERPGFATREPTDILGRAALSSPMKAFMDGAINQVSQEISGVSSNLLLGQLPKVGTTYTEVLLNEKFVAANVTTADDYLDEL
jgi:DNA-directed RNA polymerase beta' subunit